MLPFKTLAEWPDLLVVQDAFTGQVMVTYQPHAERGFITSRVLCANCEFEFVGAYPVLLDPTTLFCPSCSEFSGRGFDASSEVRVQ